MLFVIRAARFMHCRYRPQGPSTSPGTLRLLSGLELHNKTRPCCVTRLHPNILFRLSSACVNHPPSMQINHNVLFCIESVVPRRVHRVSSSPLFLVQSLQVLDILFR
jgi:hypothetical protein